MPYISSQLSSSESSLLQFQMELLESSRSASIQRDVPFLSRFAKILEILRLPSSLSPRRIMQIPTKSTLARDPLRSNGNFLCVVSFSSTLHPPRGRSIRFAGAPGGDRWCVAFHRTCAYEPPLSLFVSLVSRYSSLFGGRENKLKIAGERIAVGTFEAAAREPATVVDRSHRVSSSGC